MNLNPSQNEIKKSLEKIGKSDPELEELLRRHVSSPAPKSEGEHHTPIKDQHDAHKEVPRRSFIELSRPPERD